MTTLSREEAATQLGVSVSTILTWARARKIGSVKIGRDVRFTQEQLDQYVAAHSRPMVQPGRTSRSRAAHRR